MAGAFFFAAARRRGLFCEEKQAKDI
jgi:hypothetical protein